MDHTIIPSDHIGFSYENKANDCKAYFPSSLSSPIRIERDEEFLEVQLDMGLDVFSQAAVKTTENVYGDQVSGVLYTGKQMDVFLYPARAGI